jgi:hypothetical protein
MNPQKQLFIRCYTHNSKIHLVSWNIERGCLVKNIIPQYHNYFYVSCEPECDGSTIRNRICTDTYLREEQITSISLCERAPNVVDVKEVNHSHCFYRIQCIGDVVFKKEASRSLAYYDAQTTMCEKFMLDTRLGFGASFHPERISVETIQLRPLTVDLNMIKDCIRMTGICYLRKSSQSFYHMLGIRGDHHPTKEFTVLHSLNTQILNRYAICVFVNGEGDGDGERYKQQTDDSEFLSIKLHLKRLLYSWHGEDILLKGSIHPVDYNRLFPSRELALMLSDDEIRVLLQMAHQVLSRDLAMMIHVNNLTGCGQIEQMNPVNKIYLPQQMLLGAARTIGAVIATPIRGIKPAIQVKGGHTEEPWIGVHHDVYDLDMRAMYPSAILDLEFEGTSPVYTRLIREGYIQPLFHLRLELMKEMESLAADKDSEQYQTLNLQQMNCKLLMNKVTGVLNAGSNRVIMPNPDLYNAMTSYSRDMIKKAIDKARRFGYHTIFADTDGFLCIKGKPETKSGKAPKKARQMDIQELVDEFNQSLRRKKKYSLLVLKGKYSHVFVYGRKSYDAIKDHSGGGTGPTTIITKGAFQYSNSMASKYIYHQILYRLVFDLNKEQQALEQREEKWKRRINEEIEKSRERIHRWLSDHPQELYNPPNKNNNSPLLKSLQTIIDTTLDNIVQRIEMLMVDDLTPFASFTRSKTDPSSYTELTPIIRLTDPYDTRSWTYYVTGDVHVHNTLVDRRLRSIGAADISKETRAMMLLIGNKASQWLLAFAQALFDKYNASKK